MIARRFTGYLFDRGHQNDAGTGAGRLCQLARARAQVRHGGGGSTSAMVRENHADATILVDNSNAVAFVRNS
jgi:hypothetical protein